MSNSGSEIASRDAHLAGPAQRGAAWHVGQLRAGDRVAFDAFISEHWAPLVHYIRHRVRALEHAQDLAQESFARVWERRDLLDPAGSVVAYLYRVARNLVIDELRKLDVRRRWEEEARLAGSAGGFGSVDPGPLRHLEDRQTLDALARAVETLSDRRREAFLLVHAQGLSYREAAEVMGTAPQTVANQVASALAELRRLLGGVLTG